jgi:hypothetical protein
MPSEDIQPEALRALMARVVPEADAAQPDPAQARVS